MNMPGKWLAPWVLAGCAIWADEPDTPRPGSLHDVMREIWTDRCVWSRMVIVGTFHDLEGTDVYEERLFTNVDDLLTILVGFYGDEAEELGILFESHILIGGKVLNGIKSGDGDVLRSAEEEWYKNAQSIADSLSTLNPEYWDRELMSWMWRMQLDAVLQQAYAHEDGDWAADVLFYDVAQAEALQMADYLSTGIALQMSVLDRLPAWRECTAS